MIRTLGQAASDSTVDRTQASFLTLFHGYFETFAFPETIDSFEVGRPPFLPKQASDHEVTVARKFAGQLDDSFHKSPLVVFDAGLATLATS